MMPKLEFFPRVLSKIAGVGGGGGGGRGGRPPWKLLYSEPRCANALPMPFQCLANVLPLPQRPSPVSQFEFTVQNHAKVS